MSHSLRSSQNPAMALLARYEATLHVNGYGRTTSAQAKEVREIAGTPEKTVRYPNKTTYAILLT